jgi:hypothetical protein
MQHATWATPARNVAITVTVCCDLDGDRQRPQVCLQLTVALEHVFLRLFSDGGIVFEQKASIKNTEADLEKAGAQLTDAEYAANTGLQDDIERSQAAKVGFSKCLHQRTSSLY